MNKYLATLLILAAFAPASAHDDAIEEKRISLNLIEARASEVFPLFGVVLGVEVDLDFETEETVTLAFDRITARTALNAFCESIGCGWRLTGDDPRVLRFYSLERMLSDKRAMAYDKMISLDLNQAEAAQVFRLAAHILDVELSLESEFEAATVTLVRDRATISGFLDDICAELSCRWELASGDPPLLRVVSTP